jgi:hypothetical protein
MKVAMLVFSLGLVCLLAGCLLGTGLAVLHSYGVHRTLTR